MSRWNNAIWISGSNLSSFLGASDSYCSQSEDTRPFLYRRIDESWPFSCRYLVFRELASSFLVWRNSFLNLWNGDSRDVLKVHLSCDCDIRNLFEKRAIFFNCQEYRDSSVLPNGFLDRSLTRLYGRRRLTPISGCQGVVVGCRRYGGFWLPSS